MSKESVFIAGLPGAGKTTFLAALWQLMVNYTEGTNLKFDSLLCGSSSHLNEIARRWRNAEVQIRTEQNTELTVSMKLIDTAEQVVTVDFPDLSGESFREMWENRYCLKAIKQSLDVSQGLLLFVNANKIERPDLIAEISHLEHAIDDFEEDVIPWHPKDAPTQVMLVDILQHFNSSNIGVPNRKIAVMLSLWDTVQDEGLSPPAYLKEKLPLLDQYLRSGADGWEYRVYGLSAQGGVYLNKEKKHTQEEIEEIKRLRLLNDPTDRIKLVFAERTSKDLTEPIAWLIS